jgi:phosphomannomutase
MHDCNQGPRFDEIKESHDQLQKIVVKVKHGLDEHIDAQLEQDKMREVHREAQKLHGLEVDEKLEAIKKQLEGLIELNQEVSNIKVAWKVGKTAGANIVKFVLGMTVILGAIYGIREWFKR